jgi:hypothetical protein
MRVWKGSHSEKSAKTRSIESNPRPVETLPTNLLVALLYTIQAETDGELRDHIRNGLQLVEDTLCAPDLFQHTPNRSKLACGSVWIRRRIHGEGRTEMSR